MRRALMLAVVAALRLVIGSPPAVAAPISFTGSYSQNFDSLGTAGTAALFCA